MIISNLQQQLKIISLDANQKHSIFFHTDISFFSAVKEGHSWSAVFSVCEFGLSFLSSFM